MSESKNEKEIENEEETTMDRLVKRGVMPEVLGSIIQHKFAKIIMGDVSVGAAMEILSAEVKRIKEGSLETAENILIIQALSLNTIFNSLAYTASITDFVPHYEMLLRLAFKAQAQSRATMETLATIKNPPQVAFVKQANIGHNQQVNNNVRPESSSRAGELKIQHNQLLEEQHGERLDVGTQGQAVKANKKLAAMGKVHRAEKP